MKRSCMTHASDNSGVAAQGEHVVRTTLMIATKHEKQ